MRLLLAGPTLAKTQFPTQCSLHPHFLGKNPLFLSYKKFFFYSQYLGHFITKVNLSYTSFAPSQTRQSCLYWGIFFIFSLFWKFDSLRNQRCAIIFFLKKRVCFHNYREIVLQILNLTSKDPHSEKNLKKFGPNYENEFLAEFLFYFFIFFSKKLFQFSRYLRKCN